MDKIMLWMSKNFYNLIEIAFINILKIGIHFGTIKINVEHWIYSDQRVVLLWHGQFLPKYSH